jgi:hypothetical protein
MLVTSIPGKARSEWNEDVRAITDTWTNYFVTLDQFKEPSRHGARSGNEVDLEPAGVDSRSRWGRVTRMASSNVTRRK